VWENIVENSIFYVKAMAYLAAAIVMGIGCMGPSIGQGIIGMKACENVGKYPGSYTNIRALMTLSMVMVETSTLFCFLIALLLIFFS
jgi:F-type H+-transporting ATPase subunit c